MYWDSSALVKLYVEESDSAHYLSLAVNETTHIFSTAIVSTEILCTLSRKEQSGQIKRGQARVGFDKFLSHLASGQIRLIPYGKDVLDVLLEIVPRAFSAKHPILIRSLDAIHVASAAISGAKVLVSTDMRMRKLAEFAGISILP